MRKLTTLLTATALVATACSGGADTITEPVADAAAPTVSTYVAPATTESPDVHETVGGEIAIETTIDWGADPVSGTFDATAGADVLGCSAGTVLEEREAGGITNEFTCEDGSREGTFTIRWRIEENVDGPGDANGPWTIINATGDFAGLTGEGVWSGTSSAAIGYGSFPGSVEFGPVGEESDEGETAAGDGSVESFLAERLEDVWIREDRGTVMAMIVEPDGSVTHAARSGDGDDVVVGADDVFRIGSVTKVFTSVVTLGLVEEGLVELDAPAGDYVTRADVPDGVTVRHLLGHRSGIPSYTNGPFFDETKADDSRFWTPEDVWAHVAEDEAEFEPGEFFSYSNTNYVLLGMLIEEVTGETYDATLRSRILDPLGMADTYVAAVEDGQEPAGAYTGFFTGSLDPITADYTALASGAWSAGAMVSSATDLHAFFTALFGGGLIGEELLAEMTAATPEGYGLGIEHNPRGVGEGLYGHGGGIPGFHNVALHAPTTGRTGFWVATSDGIDPFPVVQGTAPLLLDSAVDESATESDEELPAWEQGRDGLVPAGTVRLPEVGGIQFELDQERPIIQEGPAYTIIGHEGDPGVTPAEVDLIAPTATSGGAPLTTVDELVTALTEDVVTVFSPIGEVETAIGVARGFEYSIDEESPEFDPERAWLQVGDGGWGPYPYGQMWLLETERGLFMVTAEAVDPGPLLDEAIATAALLLGTIEFADLG